MREERNVLNSDVEIPEVVLKKADDALAQIRESTKPVRKAKKERRRKDCKGKITQRKT